MILTALLIVYGLGVAAAWIAIVRIVGGEADNPMALRQSWLPAAAYALCWPIIAALAALVTLISRIRY